MDLLLPPLHLLLLLLWTLALSTPILAQQTPAQTKCTSSTLTGTAAYNDCCPGVGTSPVTLNNKRYKVICGKEIKFNTTPIWKPNPIGCTQACDANPDCISAYWTDTFGGICTLYTTVAVAAAGGSNSVALVPIPADDEECNRKIKIAETAECTTKPKAPRAPSVSGCGAGIVHGPYAGGHYYASYVGCTGQGNPIGALRISSNQQQMDVCVKMCLQSPGCVLAIREHAASTGMASRCSMKSSRYATFAKGDNDLILKIK
ncbi:hypothetical protein BDW59DRAFT_175893 [Aspergillus cavernicola]|uniref:Apple domain-containing protein n=1 Tax=Aspergillus cavernicola TaxID=176166 RepID=A0ABR4HL41_9EURO